MASNSDKTRRSFRVASLFSNSRLKQKYAFKAKKFTTDQAPVPEGHVWNEDAVRGGGARLLPQLLLFPHIGLQGVEVD